MQNSLLLMDREEKKMHQLQEGRSIFFSQTNVESEWPHSKVDNVPKVLEWIFRGKDTRIHPFLNNGP